MQADKSKNLSIIQKNWEKALTYDARANTHTSQNFRRVRVSTSMTGSEHKGAIAFLLAYKLVKEGEIAEAWQRIVKKANDKEHTSWLLFYTWSFVFSIFCFFSIPFLNVIGIHIFDQKIDSTTLEIITIFGVISAITLIMIIIRAKASCIKKVFARPLDNVYYWPKGDKETAENNQMVSEFNSLVTACNMADVPFWHYLFCKRNIVFFICLLYVALVMIIRFNYY